ncbi:hypothetical protein NDU88_007191 [Pleurodeles waltl]|uniref:Uncharacterized protein n=1 Tax=Pleurodeles waltl TaxID=8319 RepID=A0AAV7WER0_PLEWA|nr:hypothetical protein NDU88_007191 [Pleurodeles waltl]
MARGYCWYHSSCILLGVWLLLVTALQSPDAETVLTGGCIPLPTSARVYRAQCNGSQCPPVPESMVPITGMVLSARQCQSLWCRSLEWFSVPASARVYGADHWNGSQCPPVPESMVPITGMVLSASR